ncbi:hypothetical protein EM858_14460 [Agrobacterium sp. CNPSo 2736]|uniref:hypothetical protein n=1 Tax=Agrobacterium sp. CNPSo 2736 TaxID=2499627 RepID=UPI000FDA4C8E|nr:hypothetical protein [Agrobacterium sp. CNPSo 2736]RVT75646.1 hypothetical protein EM858_14460 [Agrobacterium sp. CNPSo 2736]
MMTTETQASETTVDDHLRNLIQLMKRGARLKLSDLPDDPSFLSSNIGGGMSQAIAERLEAALSAAYPVDLQYHCDVCSVPGYGDAKCSPLCDRSAAAVGAMDRAFGMSAAEAHDLLRVNAGAKRIYDCAISALSAQVQDAREPIPQNKETLDQVAAIMLQHGTPAQRAEAIAYASAAEVQDVAGWKLVPTDDETRCVADSALPHEMIEAGIRVQEQVNDDNCNYVAGETTDWDCGMVAVAIYRAMLAAAPAKQEDRILHKHTNIRSGE